MAIPGSDQLIWLDVAAVEVAAVVRVSWKLVTNCRLRWQMNPSEVVDTGGLKPSHTISDSCNTS